MTNSIDLPEYDLVDIQAALDAGEWDRAWQLLAPTCATSEDHSVLSIGALVAKARGDLTAALKLAQRAVMVDPMNHDTRHNYALLLFESGRLRPAFRQFRFLARHFRSTDAVADQAVVLLELNKPKRALTAYSRLLSGAPNNENYLNAAMTLCQESKLFKEAGILLQRHESLSALTGETKLSIHRWRDQLAQCNEDGTSARTITTRTNAPVAEVSGLRILFLAQHTMFIGDIVARLAKKNQVTVSAERQPGKLRELIAQADLVWLEWCDDTAIAVSRLPKTCPIVCRLHSYELFNDWPSKVDWSAIDHLILVSESVQELLATWHRVVVPQSVIHNGVDCTRFSVPAGKKRTKKIASVGYINYKKNPALLLHAFRAIHQYDPSYTLHIAGEHQDPRIALYFDNYLRRHPLPVVFDGWVEQMPEWYADKSYVMSTSLFESFHYSIAEGMASGLLPLVHDWYGADRLYPPETLFADPSDCLSLLKRYETADQSELIRRHRAWIETKYDHHQQTARIESLLATVVAGRRTAGGA